MLFVPENLDTVIPFLQVNEVEKAAFEFDSLKSLKCLLVCEFCAKQVATGKSVMVNLL